jgi:D-amino-acid dehydrogenase
MALQRKGAGWVLPGGIEAAEAVVALGPWAGDLTTRLGYDLPLGVKRGYHMHYGQTGNRPLTNWVQDAERGYMLAPMAKGVRLTTGAEFALRDAPSTPVQLEKAEAAAREVLPELGARLEATPWRGSRPCTPDMMPIIGKAPSHDGLWFAFGHAHHGMTLGPVTGRLVAEMMTGEKPFIDPAPYRAERFEPA